MNRKLSTHPLLLPLATAALLLFQPAAHAQIAGANSNGAGVVLDAKLLGTDVISTTLPGQTTVFGSPFLNTGTEAQGSGPPNYLVMHSVANANISGTGAIGLVGGTTTGNASLTADLLSGRASFDGSTVLGYGAVSNLSLELSALNNLPPLPSTTLAAFSLTSSELATTSTITSAGGHFAGVSTLNSFAGVSLSFLVGSSTFNVDLSGYGTGIGQIAPAPNTTVDLVGALDALGVSLVLNQQINTCAGSAFAPCTVETNALRLVFDSPSDVSLANVDLKLGHSYAEVTAVPEPSSWAMLLLGLGLAVKVARNKSRRGVDSQR